MLSSLVEATEGWSTSPTGIAIPVQENWIGLHPKLNLQSHEWYKTSCKEGNRNESLPSKYWEEVTTASNYAREPVQQAFEIRYLTTQYNNALSIQVATDSLEMMWVGTDVLRSEAKAGMSDNEQQEAKSFWWINHKRPHHKVIKGLGIVILLVLMRFLTGHLISCHFLYTRPQN